MTFSLAGCKEAAGEKASTGTAEEEISGQPEINLEDFATKSVDGIEGVSADELVLTEEEIEEIKNGNYKVAWVMHEMSDWTNGVFAGVQDAIEEFNMELVVTTDAGMDPAQQKTDIETALALQPDIMVTLVIDPVSGAEAYRTALDQGVKIAFIDNVPDGYVHPDDYVGVITSDFFGMGKGAAELLADAMGEEGEVGWIYHDADFYVTNQRDNAFKAVIQANYPNMEIVAEQGFAETKDAEGIAAAMITQHPSIGGFYVAWDTPAEGVVAACRAANRPDIKVVPLDLGANNALDMVNGGNIAGIVADNPYLMGYNMIIMGAYGMLGKESPPFIIVDATKITADNLVSAWQELLAADPPEEIMNALGK